MLKEKQISQYTILELLGESMHAEIFKACPYNQPDKIIALKRIRPEFNTKELAHHLFQSIDNLQKLDLEGVIKPDLYFVENDFIYLVQHYFNGINLQLWLNEKGKIGLDEFFAISFKLSQILNNFHKSGIFHGGVKSSNILINPHTPDIALIDPVRVIDVNEISHYVFNEYFCINTLPYISPEQTGRIRQNVDYETDLYSLGIVFYELLTGAPPFVSTDPLKIIYSHLAEIPEPINNKRESASKVVENIIAKLLSKEPEKRYRTGIGLFYDLERCWKDYSEEKSDRIFALGLRDFSNRITLPSIMVGRENEKERLLKEHALSCKGEFRAVIISGLPGIGKTRLIQELERPIIANRGYFTSGKFDQYQKNVPYSTLIQAFGNFVRILLTEDKKRIEYWRERISKAFGVNGRLITNMIPELKLITGELPEVAPLPPTEAKNRFNDVVERFISCLAGPEHPLTLFIDDLQWYNSATFEVIENIFLNSKDHPFLLFLGAYRHNEVDQVHPLCNLLERLRKMENPFTEIRIDVLTLDHTNEMVANILGTSLYRTRALSEIVDATSEGNPLYVNETLSWFYENSLIYPDKEGIWQWDTEKITKSSILESTEQLFKSKILRIPEDSLKVLQIAACMGVRFRIEDLSMITGRDEADIFRELASAFSQRILIKKKDSLSFFHDRVQEAVYATLDKKSRQDIHALIAESYIDAIPEGSTLETLENLFHIVTHLTKGGNAKADNKIFRRNTKLYHSAGKKAYNSLAFETANLYFRKSAELIDETIWDTEYEFVYSLYKDLAMSELATGNQDASQALLETLLEKSKTDLDRAECLADQAANLTSLGEFQKAIDLSIQGLTYLGKSIPENEDDIDTRIDELARKIKEVPISIDEIIGREILSDRRALIELALYSQLIPNNYMIGRVKDFFLAGLEATYLCLFLGIHEQSIHPYGVYMGFLLEQGDYESAFIYEDLILQLCNKFPDTFGAIRGMDSVTWLSLHWRNHPSFILEFSLKSIEVGKASCETYHTGLAYCTGFWSAALQGNDLKSIENLISECEKYSIKYNLPFSEDLAKGMRYAWMEPMKANGISIDISKDRDRWKESNKITSLGNYYIHAGMAEYYLGNYGVADEHLKNGEDCLIGHTNNIPNREWHIFYVLNSFHLLRENLAEEELNAVMSKIELIIEKIELWSSFGPALKPYLAFMQAELKCITGDFSETRKLYLDAIDIAHEQEYTLLEGHIHECLGELLLEHNSINQAYFHINEAANLYEKCLAGAKFNQIFEKYPEYIRSHDDKKSEKLDYLQRFDTVYMMKAAQAIYQELDIDELLSVIMRLLMEMTVSQEGYLLIEKGDDLVIRIKGKKEKHISIILEEEPLSETTGISRAMVRYVHRTGETIILNNAAKEGLFSNDKETVKLNLRSVCIHPIKRQSKLVGIICLQNNLIKSIFTEEEVENVRQLSIHAAIAMENSALVEDIKKAEKTIRDSEEHLRQSQELGRMVAWDWNIINNSVKWSGDVTSLFGRSADEITNFEVFINSLHIDDVENTKQRIQESIDTQVDYKAEYRVIKPDGSLIWLMAQGGAIRNSDGVTTNLVGVVMDNTERKQAEKALRESEERYRGIIDTAIDGIAIIDNNGILLEVNPAYCKMLGYSYNELIGMQVEKLAHPDHRHRVQDEFTSQILEKGKVRMETVGITKDGSLVLIEIHGVPFKHAGHDALLAIVRDITERRQAEKALRESEEKYRSLVESAHTGILIMDNAYHFTFVNDAMCQILERSREEIIGMDFRDFIDDESRELVADRYVRRQRGEEIPLRYEFNAVRKNGEKRRVEISPVTITDSSGNPMTLTHITDITERKQAEEELARYRDHLEDIVKERTTQLEVVNKELEAFSYSVSHDLRAPLRAINGFSEIINRRYKDTLNDDARHYFENIIDAGRYMENLIDDLLKYSRLGRRAMKKIDVHLGKLFEIVLKHMDEKIKKSNGRVTIPNDLPIVKGDETLLTQIFSNLLDNSLTYHKKDIPPEVIVSWCDEAGKIIVQVSDNGIGIAPEFHEKVFDIFQRLHNQDEYPGTGIGLSLVKKAVEMHDWSIDLDSEIGRGATFTVTLERAR
ncbi:MAG: PAS domain S-box protein [Spirochaetota bacterium]|nr:PAS domain S-box protein [Spirochaetota bacterium]